MSSLSLKQAIPYLQFDQLREAREIIKHEAEALLELSKRLDTRFCDAVDLLVKCSGRVIVTGIGKAGLIGQKISATLCSTGTPSQFLHPAEAVHGDLGCVTSKDVVIAFSNSGETQEVTRLLASIQQLGATLIAITGCRTSTLAQRADVTLDYGTLAEAGSLGLAPSTTTTAMLALGDALALVVSRQRGFTPEKFGVFHPGGNLGRHLTAVKDVMREGSQLRLAPETETIREALRRLSSSGRRTGAILVLNDEGGLSGLFTDSDLARLLEHHRDEQLDRPLFEVMTANPTTISEDGFLGDALAIITKRKISELPVVDGTGRPVGLIDITDVIGLAPRDSADGETG